MTYQPMTPAEEQIHDRLTDAAIAARDAASGLLWRLTDAIGTIGLACYEYGPTEEDRALANFLFDIDGIPRFGIDNFPARKAARSI